MYIFLSIIISHLFPSHYFYFCSFLFPFLILHFCRHNFLFSSSSFSAYSCPVSKSTPRKVKSRKAREYFAATSLFVFCGDASRQGRKTISLHLSLNTRRSRIVWNSILPTVLFALRAPTWWQAVKRSLERARRSSVMLDITRCPACNHCVPLSTIVKVTKGFPP